MAGLEVNMGGKTDRLGNLLVPFRYPFYWVTLAYFTDTLLLVPSNPSAPPNPSHMPIS